MCILYIRRRYNLIFFLRFYYNIKAVKFYEIVLFDERTLCYYLKEGTMTKKLILLIINFAIIKKIYQ